MPDNNWSKDHDASGSWVEFILTFILEGGLELAFVVLRFVGHALVALLAGILHL